MIQEMTVETVEDLCSKTVTIPEIEISGSIVTSVELVASKYDDHATIEIRAGNLYYVVAGFPSADTAEEEHLKCSQLLGKGGSFELNTDGTASINGYPE
tara:strand:- start:28 stop:324 length:297 start_codon:yes stop_codon:yes gene_type:complete